MKLRVECYAGRKAEERPDRFLLDAREYLVERVLDQWYEPDFVFFKVRTNDGNVHVLRHENSSDGTWELVSSRHSEGQK